MATSINAYDFSNGPYFSISIDADIVGICMVEILRDEYAKLAKEKLHDGDYADAMEYCRTANNFQKEIDNAKKMIANRAEEKETEDADTV